jgi:hypothetical protein
MKLGEEVTNMFKLRFAILAGILLAGIQSALAAEGERWLHIRVESTKGDGETVRVNVPLSMAEKVLPAIKSKDLSEGRIKIQNHVKDVDIRALLQAVREAPDNEFVTVQSKEENVRVAKSEGYLLVRVQEGETGAEKVEVTLPLSVVDAMLSGPPDELDIAAGIRALQQHGDSELVRVTEKDETVRIWVDTKNKAE